MLDDDVATDVLEFFPSPLTFDRLQWATFGLHCLVASLFIAGAVGFVRQGEPTGAVLQSLLALMFVGLGLVVARIVGRRT
ncbi:hypothetical protein [Haloglomus litoreum]|uniref:hypothetical protein n=1 Tax=Haloglomus litoreum TaxID=3034026 RepID=UPI0023E7EAED|nr:hypothetical protein [Haloglomus sp. DT116]